MSNHGEGFAGEALLLYPSQSSSACLPLTSFIKNNQPERIHRLVIQVDHLGWDELQRLECVLRGLKTFLKTTIIIQAQHTNKAAIEFCIPQLLTVLQKFPIHHLVLYNNPSNDILASPAFQEYILNTSRELHHLELHSCGPGLYFIHESAIKCLTLHITQDTQLTHLTKLARKCRQNMHQQSNNTVLKRLELSIRASGDSISNTTLQNLEFPPFVDTLQIHKCIDFDFMLYHALSDAISNYSSIKKLILAWDIICPERLVWGFRPCMNITNLRIITTTTKHQGGQSRQFVQGLVVLLPQWTHLKELTIESAHNGSRSSSSSNKAPTKAEFRLLISIFSHISFPRLCNLTLLLGTILDDDDCGHDLIQLVKCQSTLRNLTLPLDMKRNQLSPYIECQIAHYVGMHRFPSNVMSLEQLSLWCQVLSRATTPSVMFHLLREKNDVLIPKRKEHL